MVRKFVQRVTATGADDNTSIRDLEQLQELYPFAEFGILLSESQAGGPRFPSSMWVQKLSEYQQSIVGTKLTLSAHLCGRWVRDICAGEDEFFKFAWPSRYWKIFQRIQLNFHGYTHLIANHKDFIEVLKKFEGRQIIFQCDNVNDGLVEEAQGEGIDVAAFHDTSGGGGILPEKWPPPITNYTGYAGGLCPDNVCEELERISAVVPENQVIWIDAEGRLRRNVLAQNVFHIPLVANFFNMSEPFVTPEGKEPNFFITPGTYRSP